MSDRYHYDDVPGILEALQAEGLSLSAKRAYERRGRRGSLQYIQEDINVWKRAHGLIEVSQEDEEE
jgi:hypothetical protein